MDGFTKLRGPTGAYIYVKKSKDGSYGIADVAFREDIEHVHSDFEARQDDIIICAYPKSGLHWVWEIVTLLKTKATTSTTKLMEHRMFEIHPAKYMARLPSPRILVTHCRPEQLPSSIQRNGTQLVYIIRDPRAVAVSWFYHLSKLSPPANFNGNWKDFSYFFNNGLVPFGSWFQHIKLWLKFIHERKRHQPVHVIFYEDLIQDPMSEIQRLAKVLGLPVDIEHIEAIVKVTGFDKMKAVKEQLVEKLLRPQFKKRWQGGKLDIFRKGEQDDWKTHYSVRENEHLLKLFHSEFTGIDFRLKSLL